MTEIARWLERIGLPQYVDLFESSGVDFESLKQMTEQDLEGLGLSPTARRAVLREIELHTLATGSSAGSIYPLSSEKAERRQLTIMFCDLFNSVRLSSQLDPEDLRDVIAAYQQTCAESVKRYNGYVARYLGDGLLICFGYPAAHEDDAERAVRAGLELVDAVSKLGGNVGHAIDFELQVRVGIATGLVVAGDVIAHGVSDRDAVVGEAANLAARLQELAGPNSVVVSALTRRLAAEGFDYRDLGRRDLKGFARPISVFQVLGERQVTRLQARSAALTPFVGREQEIETLLQCWELAAAGEGQVVIICGEAGIGKSRIAAELQSRVQHLDSGRNADPSPPLIFQCSPYHTNTPLHPVTRQLERLAGIGRLDTGSEKFSKLDAMIGPRGTEFRENIPLFADLLGIEQDGRLQLPSVSPAVKRQLIIRALTDWCASRGGDSSRIIAFEDVQWIDPTSRLFLRRLVRRAAGAKILIMITLRTASNSTAETFLKDAEITTADVRSPSHVTVCEVPELGEAEARQLAAAAAGRTISESQFNAVLTKAEGIPLYVEELIKAVAHGMDLSPGEDDGRVGTVPNTISDALMAQLDQLVDAKEVAQHAAVIGQEFPVDLLVNITGRSHNDLRPQLDRLIDSRIIIQNSATADTYRFRHALIRDIAYHSLLRKRRRQIHLRIATEFARRSPGTIDATNDLIAQHYSLGDAHFEAIGLWQEGAKDAIGRSAYEEALGMLRAALADLGRLRGSKRPALELELVLAQAMALRSIRGYSAPEVEGLLIKARELCAVCSDTSNRFNVEWGLFQCTIVKGDIVGAHQLATGLYRHAEHHPNQPWADAHLANGMVAFHFGDFEMASSSLEKGINASHPETDEPHFLTHGQSPGLFCLSYLARTLCLLGYLDRARSTIDRGLAIARTLARDPAHIYGYVNVLIHAVRVYELCGDFEVERQLAYEAVDISRRNHFAYYEAMASCHIGWVVGTGGSLSEGIDRMVGGLADLMQTGTELALPGFYVLLAQLYLRAGRFDDANDTLRKAVGPRSFRTRVWDADIERVRGDISALRPVPDWEEAENAYQSSLTIARRQRAGLLFFKAAIGLARLLERLDRRKEAHVILTQGLERLHEGFDTQEAQAAQRSLRTITAANL